MGRFFSLHTISCIIALLAIMTAVLISRSNFQIRHEIERIRPNTVISDQLVNQVAELKIKNNLSTKQALESILKK